MTKNFSVNIRQAAYAVAVDRVVEAMRLRGWVVLGRQPAASERARSRLQFRTGRGGG